MNRTLFANFLDDSSDPGVNRARDRCLVLALFLLAVALYAPGVFWGLPEANSPDMIESQVADELGPWGVFTQLNAARGHGSGAIQWPLAHYLVVALFYAPYLFLLLATGGWTNPTFVYPFGFSDPAAALRTLAVIARLVSALMGAGTVVAIYSIGKNLWDRASGLFAAVFMMLLPPIFFYARTSNVDVPSIFWASLVLAVFARFLRDGELPLRRSVWIGLLTAVAVATKDQNFAVLALLPLAMLPLHIQTQRKQGIRGFWGVWRAPIIGGIVCGATYLVLSGLAIRPAMYARHLDHIFTPGKATNFYRLPPTLAGYATLAYEAVLHLVNHNLGWLLSAAAVVGVFLCWWSHPRALALLLPIPSLFFFGLMPVRHVAVRYVMPWALVLVCFAGYAIAVGLREKRRSLRAVTCLVLLVVCTVSFLRGAELTYLLYRGTLYQASQWLQTRVRPSDRVEYFGWRRRVVFLPQLNGRATWLLSSVENEPGSGTLSGEFVILMGAPDLEAHEACPGWVYAGLNDGSLGYVAAAHFPKRSFFSHAFAGNPEIQLFVRRERAQEVLQSRPR